MKITICGSTRFKDEWKEWEKKLTLSGHIVYSVAMFGREEGEEGKDHLEPVTKEEKWLLDLVHFRKIQESDAIVVINVDGYIGESTTREILWAYKILGLPVYVIDVVRTEAIEKLVTDRAYIDDARYIS